MYMIKKVNLKSINPSTIPITKRAYNTFCITLSLDKEPEDDWKEIFKEEAKSFFQPPASLKRQGLAKPLPQTTYQVDLGDETITLITNLENYQKDIKTVMRLVEGVNDKVDKQNLEAKHRKQAEKMESERNQKIIEDMRESLRKNPPTL
jgi:predicted ribosome quality control (RQC) complex YloA/Tae2 family protein